MKPFELKADMLTGIEAIDNQHRKLLSWTNDLTSDNTIANAQKVKETLHNLQGYVAYHFHTEEEEMVSYNYDLLKKHKNQHIRLMNEVNELLSRARGKEAEKGTLVELQYMLTDWIQLHIKEWDQPFALFVKNAKN
jgi:hemerythrin